MVVKCVIEKKKKKNFSCLILATHSWRYKKKEKKKLNHNKNIKP